MRRPSLDAVRGFDRAVYVIALGQFINVFGSGLVYPFATIHFHLEVGVALAVVGFGLGAKSATTAVGTAVGGYLADAVGRKPVMVASMAAAAVALAGFAFVPELAAVLPGGVAAATGVSRLGAAFVLVATAAGFAGGLYTPAASALTADLTDGEERDRGYALLKVANNVGFGAGLVAGGLLYAVASVAVFLADGLTSGVVAVVLLLFVPRDAGEAGSRGTDAAPDVSLARWWAAATRPRVLALAAINVGFAVMYAQMQTTIPIVAKDGLGLTAAQVGTLFVLNPLTIVLLQLPLVDAIGDWRRTRGLAVAAAFWAASMVAAWGADVLASGETLLAAGVALVGAHLVIRTVGEILHSPLASALMSDLGTAGERGTQLSVLEVSKRVGFGVGSFVGAAFFDYGLSALLWPTLAAVCLGMVLGLLALERSVTPGENGARGAAPTVTE